MDHDHDTISDMILTSDFNIDSSSEAQKYKWMKPIIDTMNEHFSAYSEISS